LCQGIPTIPKALFKCQEKVAADSRKSASAVAKEAIAAHVGYLESRKKAIETGIESGKRDVYLSTEEVLIRFNKKRAAIAGKKTKENNRV
jgi:predicted transcriptional regulator